MIELGATVAGQDAPNSTQHIYPLPLDAAVIAEALAEAEASASHSAEAHAWLTLLHEVLDQDEDVWCCRKLWHCRQQGGLLTSRQNGTPCRGLPPGAIGRARKA
jgi:hypothetical protein